MTTNRLSLEDFGKGNQLTNIYETALEYESMGLAPVPFQVFEKKCVSLGAWREDFKSVKGWEDEFSQANGIGILLGKKGKNTCTIDVDEKHDPTRTLSKRFLIGLKYAFSDIYDSLYIESTRSNGLHIIYRILGEVPTKSFPAYTMENGRRIAIIEFLGEGQLVFTHPSPGYKILQGSIEEIPTITMEQHNELLEFSKSFNEVPDTDIVEEVTCPEFSKLDPSDKRPGSRFNQTCDPHKFAKWLFDFDWKENKRDGDCYYLTRPGKEHGVSATWNYQGNRKLIVFSSSTDFQSRRNGELIGHTPFSVYTKLQCGGNYKLATKMLVDAGFVDKGDWLDIHPIKMDDVEPFDMDELIPECCAPLKRFVKGIAKTMQVEPEMVFIPTISSISLTLCGTSDVRLNDTWVEPPPFWGVVVAKPSERKSPVMNTITRPIYEKLNDINVKFGMGIKEFQIRKKKKQAEIDDIEKRIYKTGKNSIPIKEGLIAIDKLNDDLELMPKFAENPRILQSDITPEALAWQTSLNGGYTGVISSEADPILCALGQYSSQPMLPIYLKGYSRELYSNNRKGAEHFEIPYPYIVVSVAFQPTYMKDLANNSKAHGSGFLARPIYAIPRSKLGKRTFDEIPLDPNSLIWWKGLIGSLLDRRKKGWIYKDENDEYQVWDKDPFEIELTDEAKAIFKELHDTIEPMLGEGGEYDDGSGWGGKLMGNVARYAHCLHWAAGRDEDSKIDAEIMAHACRLPKYATEHYYAATGQVIGSDPILRRVVYCYRKIIRDGLHKKCKTVRELFMKVRDKRHKSVEDWTHIFEKMEEMDYIRIDKNDGKKGTNLLFHPNFEEVLS